MGREQLLETDDLSALLYCDFRKSHCLLNISFFLFRTGHLNSSQFDQCLSSPMGTENFENANRLKMKCQDVIVFAIEFFLIVLIMITY